MASHAAEQAPAKPRHGNCWTRTTARIELWVEDRLASLAYFAARRPVIVMLVTFLFAGAAAAGFAFIEMETTAERLWVPQESVTMLNGNYVDKYFAGGTGAFSSFLIAPKDGGNMLTLANMNAAVQFVSDAMNVTTVRGYNYWQLCGDAEEGDCTASGFMSFWEGLPAKYTAAGISSDAELRRAMSVTELPGGHEVIRTNAMAGITVDASNNVTSARAVAFVLSVDWCTYIDGKCDSDTSSNWMEAITDLVMEDRPHITAFVQTASAIDDELESAVTNDIPLVGMTYAIMIAYTCFVLGKCNLVESRSMLGFGAVLSVALSTAAGYGICMYMQVTFTSLQQLLPFILLGIGIDDAFIIVNAYDCTNKNADIPTRCALAMRKCGMSITLTSLTDACAFALGASTVLPAVSFFCVYASVSILLDYVFQVSLFVAMLSLDERRKAANRMDVLCCITVRRKPAARVTPGGADDAHGVEMPFAKAASTAAATGGGAAAGAGAGVTTASGIAFDPAAALAASTDSANNSSSSRRGGAHDDVHAHAAETFGRRMMRDYYGPFLMKTPVKVAVLVVFFTLLGVSIWGATQVGTNFSVVDLTQDDSPTRAYLNAVKEYHGDSATAFGGATRFGIYVRDVDFHDAGIQTKILQFNKAVHDSPEVAGPASSWLTSFLEWCSATGSCSAYLNADGLFDGGASEAATGAFYTALNAFLATDNGEKYETALAWNGTRVQAARSHDVFKPQSTSAQELAGLESLEAISAEASANGLPGSFCFEFQMQFWEQHRVILPELTVNFALCLAAVCVICAVILVHPAAVLLLALVVAMIDVDLLGALYFWGLQLNTISVINLVMAVGLVVDFSAHIIHNFSMHDPRKTANERVIDTLADMGPAVMMGGLTTFFGILPVIFSKSEVFRVFFKCFLSIVVYGVSHGVVLVPVLLSIFPGAAGHKSVEEYLAKARELNGNENGHKATQRVAQGRVEPEPEAAAEP